MHGLARSGHPPRRHSAGRAVGPIFILDTVRGSALLADIRVAHAPSRCRSRSSWRRRRRPARRPRRPRSATTRRRTTTAGGGRATFISDLHFGLAAGRVGVALLVWSADYLIVATARAHVADERRAPRCWPRPAGRGQSRCVPRLIHCARARSMTSTVASGQDLDRASTLPFSEPPRRSRCCSARTLDASLARRGRTPKMACGRANVATVSARRAVIRRRRWRAVQSGRIEQSGAPAVEPAQHQRGTRASV